MTDTDLELVKMVKEKDISSVEIMADKLSIDEDEIRQRLLKLTEENRLNGYLTDDGERYFRKDVKPSDRPKIPVQMSEPEFLHYDTRPGKIIAIIGLIVVVAAVILLSLAGGDLARENTATIVLLAGLLIMMGGCYHIGRRQTP